METFVNDSDSVSSGEDHRMQRRRRNETRTVMSAVAEANIPDASSYVPRRGGYAVGEQSTEIERYYNATLKPFFSLHYLIHFVIAARSLTATDLDKDCFNILNLVTAPRLEPESERRYRMPPTPAQSASLVPHSTRPSRAQRHIFSTVPAVPARLQRRDLVTPPSTCC
jgi:hypothetical protein